MTVGRIVVHCESAASFPLHPIARITSPNQKVVRQTIVMSDATVVNGGKKPPFEGWWNVHSVGLTTIAAWRAFSNMGRKRIVLLCESFSSSTIWMPFFQALREF